MQTEHSGEPTEPRATVTQHAGLHTSNESGSGIAPLERFHAPPGMDGREGRFRTPSAQCIEAVDDREAVLRWLAETVASDSADRGYRSAVEKLLNWCCYERGIALSSLDGEAFRAFANFLLFPAPVDRWICLQGTRRTDGRWRPFTGPLSARSQSFVLRVTQALLRWLGTVGYANLRIFGQRRDVEWGEASINLSTTQDLGRVGVPLRREDWAWIARGLQESVENPSGAQRALVVELMYYAGLRCSEIEALREADLRAPCGHCSTWKIHVSSRRPNRQWIYALPPLCRRLTDWVNTCANERCDEHLVAHSQSIAAARARAAIKAAAGLAEAAGDCASAARLYNSSVCCLSVALAQQAEPDAFSVWQLIGVSACQHQYVARYAVRHELTADDLARAIRRLSWSWQEA